MAEGIQFSNGKVVVSWLGVRSSVVVWNSVDDALYIHGHGGKTKVVWLDENLIDNLWNVDPDEGHR